MWGDSVCRTQCVWLTVFTIGLLAGAHGLASAAPGDSPDTDSANATTKTVAAPTDFAIRNVRVFDGTKVIPRATVVIHEGRITQVAENVDASQKVDSIDGAGKTLLPGLIDCHTHAFFASQLETAAVFGVTTELDMAGNPDFAAKMRSQQSTPQAKNRADLRSAGTPVTAKGGHPTQIPWFNRIDTLDSPDRVREFVAARVAEGSDYIKIILDDGRAYGINLPTISPQIFQLTVEAAHRHNRLAVAHIATRKDARTAISSGIDGLVHIFVDEPIDDELTRLARDRKVFVVPTLTVLESAAGTAGGRVLSEIKFFQAHLTSQEIQNLKATYPRQPNSRVSFDVASRAVGKLHAAGVPILAGTDAPNPGTAHGASMHRELELLVEAGLSPTEALAGATSRAAASFRLSDRGRIAPGLRADLVLVEGDPTQTITDTRRIVRVWKEGKPVDLEGHHRKIKAVPTSTPSRPKRIGKGLVSNFEGKKPTSNFGYGWIVSTDELIGGKSTAKFQRVDQGANDSEGSLMITGTVADRPQPRWAGAIFCPGQRPMAPADLSDGKWISFEATGDGKSYYIMLFFTKNGFQPATKSFAAGDQWTKHRFKIDAFNGCDGSDIMGIFFGAGSQKGDFQLQIDNVRIE